MRTQRLILRSWRDTDFDKFAALSADPEVMEFFPAPVDPAVSIAWATEQRDHIDATGWGLWAVEVPGVADFIGFIGIWQVKFMDAVEIGWRLDKPYWGQGYATEGARAALAYGFTEVGLDEIVSFTAHQNVRSQAVMERIGMVHDPRRDFEHPRVPEGHWLKPHVLYAITAEQWRAQTAGTAPAYDL